MTDQTAALAEALRVADATLRRPTDGTTRRRRRQGAYWWRDYALAILAALRPDWCGHEAKPGRWAFVWGDKSIASHRESHLRELDEITADMARLRAIETAARSVTKEAYADDDFEGAFIDYLVPAGTLDALRTALEETP